MSQPHNCTCDICGASLGDTSVDFSMAAQVESLTASLSSMKRERDGFKETAERQYALAWGRDAKVKSLEAELQAALEQVKVARELVERATFQHQAECEEYQGTGECNCVYEKAKAFLATLDGATLSKGGKG